MRTLSLLLLSPCLFLLGANAQPVVSETALISLLAGADHQQWSVIGTRGALGAACERGDGYFTFHRKASMVEEQACEKGAFVLRKHTYAVHTTDGDAHITFMDKVFRVTSLPKGAPVCEGHDQCIRLSSLPDGQSDAPIDFYLTR